MNKHFNLDELEKKAFKSTYEDGLWDIMLGIIFLAFAAIPILSVRGLGDFWSSLLILPFFAIGYAIFALGKGRITYPRAGVMKIGSQRKKKIARIHIFLNVFLALGILTGFTAFEKFRDMDWFFPAVFAVLILICFSLGARYLDFPRLGYYGAGLTVFVLIGEVLFREGVVTHHGYPLVFGSSGFTIMCIGVVLLLRFMKKYSIPGKEAAG